MMKAQKIALWALAAGMLALAGLGMGAGLTACDTATNPGGQVEEDEYDAEGYNKKTGFNKEGYNKAGYNASGFNKAGYDVNGYDKNGYNVNGYDKNGYDKTGYNTNGFDKDGYDKTGYNTNGYNKNGFDKNGYDVNGYDANGYDVNGQKKPNGPGPDPDVEIPSYTRHSYETVKDITFTPMVGTYTLDNILPYTNSQTGRNLQGAIYTKWLDLLCQMQVQGDNLKNGYNAVKGAYPDLTGINDIITRENSIHGKIDNTSNIGTYLSGADADINAILNGIFGGNHTQFNKLLDAYQKGNYAGQKVRNEDGSKSDAEEAFQTALAQTGLSFDELEPAMRDAINAAMGVDGIESAKHRDAISGLNGDLVKQIGDLEEARALADDFDGLDYKNTLTPGYTFPDLVNMGENQYNKSGTESTVPSVTKATHLTAGFGAVNAKVPGTKFLDKFLSRKTVPGTFLCFFPTTSFTYSTFSTLR
jgi:hypothetical protein